jgi:hypothetical protein
VVDVPPVAASARLETGNQPGDDHHEVEDAEDHLE